jgi:hypothetical protein
LFVGIMEKQSRKNTINPQILRKLVCIIEDLVRI